MLNYVDLTFFRRFSGVNSNVEFVGHVVQHFKTNFKCTAFSSTNVFGASRPVLFFANSLIRCTETDAVSLFIHLFIYIGIYLFVCFYRRFTDNY